MTIIILAAGVGNRFNRNVKNNIPKCLIEIDGNKTILDWNLRTISKYGEASEIIIVTGFKNEVIDRHIKLNYPNENTIKTIFNSRFRESVVFSVKVALAANDSGKSVFLLNGDTIYSKNVFINGYEIFVKNKDSVTLFGNITNEFCSDDMLVYVKHGKMKKVGKKIKNANAVSAGAILVCNGGFKKYMNILYSNKTVKSLNTHHKILQIISDTGYDIDFHNLGRRDWYEIDTPQDLFHFRISEYRVFQ